MESENIHPGDIDDADKEESALYEEPVIFDGIQQATDGKPTDKSVFGTAKDAVINIVRKAAQVLVKSGKNTHVIMYTRKYNYEYHLKYV